MKVDANHWLASTILYVYIVRAAKEARLNAAAHKELAAAKSISGH